MGLGSGFRVKLTPNLARRAGRSFVLKSLKSTDTFPKPYLQVMRIIVWCGNRVGKKTKFTFYKGGSQEENLLSILLGPFPYATGGYVSKAEFITYSTANSLNIFGKSYGTVKLDPSSTKDYMVWSCADTYVPGPPCCTGYAYQPHACCTYSEAQGSLPRGGAFHCSTYALHIPAVAPQVSNGYTRSRGHYKCVLEAE